MATKYSKNKTSNIIEGQLPDFIQEEYPTFIRFIKSYYEFLEKTDPPVTIPLHVPNPNPFNYYPTEDYAKKWNDL